MQPAKNELLELLRSWVERNDLRGSEVADIANESLMLLYPKTWSAHVHHLADELTKFRSEADTIMGRAESKE